MPTDNNAKALLPVDEARARILDGLVPGGTERCALADAIGRVLASDVASRLSLPPEAVSAMDGYAARHCDCQTIGTTLTRIGESAAGRPWDGSLAAGETVRIFTGAVVPDGADCIILQEDVDADSENDGAAITIKEVPGSGQFIRPAGLDVTAGDIVLTAGTTMSARLISLATSAGHTEVSVWHRPHIGVLSTGDELVLPGGCRSGARSSRQTPPIWPPSSGPVGRCLSILALPVTARARCWSRCAPHRRRWIWW